MHAGGEALPDTPGYTAENQMEPPPSYRPFMSPLPASPLLLGLSKNTAESSVLWQSGVGKRMSLSLLPMSLDHVGPEAALFGCCRLTWPFVNSSLSVSSTKSQNQWGSQSQGGRDAKLLSLMVLMFILPRNLLLILQPKSQSCHIHQLMQAHTCGEGCPLMPPTRTIVDSGTGHPEPAEMSVTPSGQHQ